MEKVVAIIQARMGSTRLPGKVLKPVGGRPLLSYLVERVKRAKLVTDIIVATTDKPDDDRIADFCQEEGIVVHRGAENDVLDRYRQAAAKANADYVMRLTGDNPLIDPEICDRVVATMFEEKVDYVGLDPSFADGLDCCVISRAVLEEMWEKAELASEREHVTLFLHNNKDSFSVIRLRNETDDSHIRLTVDEQRDYEVVRRIFESLYRPGYPMRYADIRRYLMDNPQVFDINSGIQRNEGLEKSLEKDGVFSQDASSSKIGLKLYSTDTSLVPEAVRAFESGMFSYIELYAVPGSYFDCHTAFLSRDIPFTVHGPHFGHGVNLADRALRESNLKGLEDARRFADFLNAPWIIVHGGFGGCVDEVIEQGKVLNDGRLVIENIPAVGTQGQECVGVSPEDISRIKLSPGFQGFILDVGHAVYAANHLKRPWRDFLREFVELAPLGCHLADGLMSSVSDVHKSLGEGDFPLAGMVAMLPQGARITLETPRSPEGLESFVRDRNYLMGLPGQGTGGRRAE